MDECHNCIPNHIQDHVQSSLKIGQLCLKVKDNENEIKEMNSKIEKRFDSWEKKQTGILVSVILLLVSALFNIGIHFLKGG